MMASRGSDGTGNGANSMVNVKANESGAGVTSTRVLRITKCESSSSPYDRV